jgi:1-deoxy-D-xylulose-5-phosphate reductoisomerase
LILTASGGPFRTKSQAEINNATRAEALDHPNWKMGDKITIDSATLMNKGFEVMEAKWLFGFGPHEISVVIHPQSVVHSMVEMVDGSVMAQMGATDMKHAIQYALTFPERRPNCTKTLDFSTISNLTFEVPDLEKFPCLALAYRALEMSGTAPAALNAANEVSVESFLNGRIAFPAIARVNEAVLESHKPRPADGVPPILDADRSARNQAAQIIGRSAVAHPV